MIGKTIRLQDGNKIPQLGFGTWQLKGKTAYNAVRAAIDSGYRHIDTAAIYGNEEKVGQAIKDAGIPREDIFVTTKLWNNDQSFDSAMKAIDKSLDKLQLDYVDLYLVHWPVDSTRLEAYEALEEIQKQGKAISIGVSNYMVNHLEELLNHTKIVPAVNQIELHPFNFHQREDVVDFCHDHDIAVEAYSPLVQARKFSNEVLQSIAEHYDASPAQVLIRWHIQQGNIVIPRSSSAEHIESNSDVFNFELNFDDMDKLRQLNENLITTMDPEKF